MVAMDDIRFERHFRTPSSEGYYIMQGDSLQLSSRLEERLTFILHRLRSTELLS